MGRDELDRSQLVYRKPAEQGIDTDSLTGSGDKALDRANYPTGRESANDDSDLSINPSVMHNHNRQVIGVHKAKRKSGKPESMYAPVDRGPEGDNQGINDAGRPEEPLLTMQKSNDATPAIDPDSVEDSQLPVDSPSETPNDPRDYLEHVDPVIQQTSHSRQVATPQAMGMQWADYPTGLGMD